jgi:hypothetical protein
MAMVMLLCYGYVMMGCRMLLGIKCIQMLYQRLTGGWSDTERRSAAERPAVRAGCDACALTASASASAEAMLWDPGSVHQLQCIQLQFYGTISVEVCLVLQIQ